MKGTTALPKTWKGPKPARAETESLIEDAKAREFHQGTGIDHEHDPATDAGYMAATFPSADQRFSSCIAGRTIYGPFYYFRTECITGGGQFVSLRARGQYLSPID